MRVCTEAEQHQGGVTSTQASLAATGGRQRERFVLPGGLLAVLGVGEREGEEVRLVRGHQETPASQVQPQVASVGEAGDCPEKLAGRGAPESDSAGVGRHRQAAPQPDPGDWPGVA